jgi:hypothetical protein
VGSCVNGRWEVNCSDDSAVACGPKPGYAPAGCRVGECVNGVWQLICTEPIPVPPLD